MDRDELGQRVSRGLAWIGAASSIIAALDTLSNFAILALWISPEQQGIAAAAMWLFPILDMLIDGGLSAAIVQREEVTHEQLSTIFWLNVGMSGLIAGLVVVLGTPITGSAAAGSMLAVYGLKLLLQNVFFVPQALMRRELRFKELSLIRIAANLFGFSTRVVSAAAGAGPWCYLIGNFTHSIVTAIGIQSRRRFRPSFTLRLRQAAADIRFGVTTALREILFHVYTNADYRVVIAFFGREANGLYSFAYSTILNPVRYFSQVVVEVAFPAFSRLRHDRPHAIEQFISFTRLNLVVVLPYVALIGLTADDLVTVIFGARWMPAVNAMRLLCAVGILRGMSFVMPPLLEGLGYPRRSLTYAACASVIMPSLYVLSAWLLGPRFGWSSLAIAWVVGFPVAFAILAKLALSTVGLDARTYLRRVIRIPCWLAIATLAGWGVRVAASSLGAPARLVLSATTLLGVAALLLSRFEGMGLRFVAASLRGGSGRRAA